MRTLTEAPRSAFAKDDIEPRRLARALRRVFAWENSRFSVRPSRSYAKLNYFCVTYSLSKALLI
ncbi:MAG: hypothetical protein JWM68_391 [Verrucomicrobiales bacterium]|nr:hypothetical protein [Verrucomicrobiales bacterium]